MGDTTSNPFPGIRDLDALDAYIRAETISQGVAPHDAVKEIEYTVLIDSVIGDMSTQDLDVNATMDRYIEQFRAALADRFSKATIRLHTQLASGVESMPKVVVDDVFPQDMGRELLLNAQNDAADRVLEIAERVFNRGDYYMYLDDAEELA